MSIFLPCPKSFWRDRCSIHLDWGRTFVCLFRSRLQIELQSVRAYAYYMVDESKDEQSADNLDWTSLVHTCHDVCVGRYWQEKKSDVEHVTELCRQAQPKSTWAPPGSADSTYHERTGSSSSSVDKRWALLTLLILFRR
jgi:hypothetical protein